MSLQHLLKNFSHQWSKKSRDKALRSPSTKLRVKEANAAPVSQLRFLNTEYVTVCSRQLYLSSPTEISPTQALWLRNKLWSNKAMDFTPLYNEQHNLRRLTCIFSWKLHVHILHSHILGFLWAVTLPDPQPTTIVCVITFAKLPVSNWKKIKHLFRAGYINTNLSSLVQFIHLNDTEASDWCVLQ